jgi:hypothetical protein
LPEQSRLSTNAGEHWISGFLAYAILKFGALFALTHRVGLAAALPKVRRIAAPDAVDAEPQEFRRLIGLAEWKLGVSRIAGLGLPRRHANAGRLVHIGII